MKAWKGLFKPVCALMILASGIAASVFVYRDASFGTLQYYHELNTVRGPVGQELVKGTIVHGEFTSAENNLGIVAIPVKTFNRINKDIIVFRLKEKKSLDWLVFNKYVTDRFPTNVNFPFGFPVITDSAGKTYEFEIYSVNGLPGNAIGIGGVSHRFESQYTYTKSDLLRDRQHFINFMQRKTQSLLGNASYLSVLFMFCIPFILYVISNPVPGSDVVVLRKYRWLSHLVLVLTIYAFVIHTAYYKGMISIYVGVLLFVVIFVTGLPVRQTLFRYALGLLLLSPLWVSIGMEQSASKSAILIFYLVTGALVFAGLEYLFHLNIDFRKHLKY